MRDFHPEYIIDSKQNKKSVILPIEEWKEILQAIEELEDMRAYDIAKRNNEEIIPFAQAVEEIDRNEG